MQMGRQTLILNNVNQWKKMIPTSIRKHGENKVKQINQLGEQEFDLTCLFLYYFIGFSKINHFKLKSLFCQNPLYFHWMEKG